MDPFRGLFEDRRRAAIASAERIVGNHAEAEEIAQDAFLEVWRRSGAAGVQPTSAWVGTTVRCRAIDRVRRRATAMATKRALADAPAAPWNGDFTRAEDRADEEAVHAALASLPAAQREAVELVYLQGLTHVQAAAATHVPLGTLKTRVRLAIARLLSALSSGAEQETRKHDDQTHAAIVAPHVDAAAVRHHDAARDGERHTGAERTRPERLKGVRPLAFAQEA